VSPLRALCTLTFGLVTSPAAAEPLPVGCAWWGLLWPGASHLCAGQTAEGATLAGLAAAEAGATAAVWAAHGLPERDPEDASSFLDGRMVPAVAFQNTWAYGVASYTLDLQRQIGLDRVPPERLGELARAPFDPAVLRQPAVWGGTLGLLAGGAALTVALGAPPSTWRPGADTNYFGAALPPAAGAPAFAASTVYLMEHVAIGEEVLFRGLLQSGMSRRWGDAAGFWAGTLLFGAAHATNLPYVPEDERLAYAAVGLPWITLAGGWLGHTYRRAGYSLAGPVALHFWYNTGVSALEYLADPGENLFSVQIDGAL